MAGTYGFQQLYDEKVSAVTASPSVVLGTRRVEGGVDYVYAYNAGNSQINPGYGCIASCNSGFSMTLSAAAADALFGVVVHATFTTATYGWLATRGPVHVYSVGAIAADGPATLGANGTFEQALTALAGGTHMVCGYSTTAIASAGTGLIWMRANV